ncbi:tRNA1(Val) (adenine(37)-N6)-methyltransferase [Flavitalea flava]
MPNPFFTFKQFTIYQDACAMKVCTDACLFGAWFAGNISVPGKVLDIGSGTGLLMLMLAQKQTQEIHGIELDPAASGQSEENICGSPWKDRLRVINGDARNFSFPGKYDFVLTNPPFYEGDLLSGTRAKDLAKHSQELTLSALINVIDTNLSPEGKFGILLPYHRMDYFKGLAEEKKFFLQESVSIRQTPRHDFFRVILYFSRKEAAPSGEKELIIKNEQGLYSDAFVALLKDYYLYL